MRKQNLKDKSKNNMSKAHTKCMDYTQIQEVSTIWQGVRNKRKKEKEMDETTINLELC